jgi:hypothetical protein
MTYDEAAKGEIKADLRKMYQAGKVDLPQRANHMSDVAGGMSDAISSVNIRTAQMGDWAVLVDVLDLAVDCQNGMAKAVTSINNLALAVVAQADDFRDRDDYAQSVFDGFGDRLQGSPDPLPAPPTSVDKDTTVDPGAPYHPENPDVQDPEDELEDRDLLLDAYQNFGGEE